MSNLKIIDKKTGEILEDITTYFDSTLKILTKQYLEDFDTVELKMYVRRQNKKTDKNE